MVLGRHASKSIAPSRSLSLSKKTRRRDAWTTSSAPPKALDGEPFDNRKPPGYPFDDTDVYKVIEGASYSLSLHLDPRLDAYVDSIIAKIAVVQEKDGYHYTARTNDPLAPHRWADAQRWVPESVNSRTFPLQALTM